jgi:hypothetical protein
VGSYTQRPTRRKTLTTLHAQMPTKGLTMKNGGSHEHATKQQVVWVKDVSARHSTDLSPQEGSNLSITSIMGKRCIFMLPQVLLCEVVPLRRPFDPHARTRGWRGAWTGSSAAPRPADGPSTTPLLALDVIDDGPRAVALCAAPCCPAPRREDVVADVHALVAQASHTQALAVAERRGDARDPGSGVYTPLPPLVPHPNLTRFCRHLVSLLRRSGVVVQGGGISSGGVGVGPPLAVAPLVYPRHAGDPRCTQRVVVSYGWPSHAAAVKPPPPKDLEEGGGGLKGASADRPLYRSAWLAALLPCCLAALLPCFLACWSGIAVRACCMSAVTRWPLVVCK